MVFEGKVDAMLLGFGQALLNGIDAPFETVFHSVPGQNGFFPAQFHQVVEVAGRSPAPRIKPDGRDAHFVSEPDAFFGVLDIFFAGGGIG